MNHTCEKPAFITTDHPVALSHTKLDRPAFCSPGTVIHFPISPTRLLVIGHPDFRDGVIYPVRETGIPNLNFLIFRSAYRHVFSAWDPVYAWREMIEVGDRLKAEARRTVDNAVSAIYEAWDEILLPLRGGRKFKRCCGL